MVEKRNACCLVDETEISGNDFLLTSNDETAQFLLCLLSAERESLTQVYARRRSVSCHQDSDFLCTILADRIGQDIGDRKCRPREIIDDSRRRLAGKEFFLLRNIRIVFVGVEDIILVGQLDDNILAVLGAVGESERLGECRRRIHRQYPRKRLISPVDGEPERLAQIQRNRVAGDMMSQERDFFVVRIRPLRIIDDVQDLDGIVSGNETCGNHLDLSRKYPAGGDRWTGVATALVAGACREIFDFGQGQT